MAEAVDDGRDLDAERFCVELMPQLTGVLTLQCGSRDLAEELVQDVLVRVLANWPRVRSRNDPRAYTVRIAFNTANSWYRRRSAERRATDAIQTPQPAEDEPAARLAVREAVARLPMRQRTALVCRYYADLSVDQTATVMGCSSGTVKAHTAKAHAGLRRQGLLDDEVTVDG